MGRWSCSPFVVFFLCGAFIREARQASISDVGGQKDAQRHLLMEVEDHTNINDTEIRSKQQTLPSSNYLQPGVFEEL